MLTFTNLSPQMLALLVIFAATAIIFLWAGFKLGKTLGRRTEENIWKTQKVEEIVKARIKTSRAVLGGQFSEQLAPYLPDFPYNPSDCRFMGKPIDFLVFSGMDQKEISEVVFVEVKSGKAKALSPQEKKLKEAIIAGRVRWEQYNVAEDITE